MTRIRFHTPAGYCDPWHLYLFASRDVPGRPDSRVIIHSAQETVVTASPETPIACSPEITPEMEKPLLMIDRKDPGLEELMNHLWDLGIRPRDIGSPGHLAATQKHLEDMRAIAFHKTGVKQP